MKKFKIYRNIRKRALIFGLPLTLFALQMLGVIGSLLIVIFSFSFLLVIGAIIVNALLYAVLIKMVDQPHLLHFSKVFPQAISNKKTSILHYENQS